MKLKLHAFDLELEHTFTISRESHNIQPTLIVELTDRNLSGYGEATSNPYYGITVPGMVDSIKIIEPLLEKFSELTPIDFWKNIYTHLKHNMFALCALDMAFNDLYAKKNKLKLYELWQYDISNNVQSNYTIGLDSIPKMIEKMKAFPWPIYKIKLGTANDLDIVKALRAESNAIFRIDANAAWNVEETLKNAIELKKLGVEFIEQPLAADNSDGAEHLYKESVLPIIADESCIIESDVEACFNRFHGINIKLTKCGGLTPARRMITKAKVLGMKTMVGCMTESSVGISAIAHLLPELDYVDMDGALLLKKDIASGVKLVNGYAVYSENYGTGARLI